jgi:tetratricopeptide (TPR) repeat protein
MALQGLWFSIPVLSRSTLILSDVAPLDPYKQVDTVHWIAFGHFAQYLWITTYYAKEANEARAPGTDTGKARYYVKALMAGALVWGVPSLLFAPSALGVRPFDAGLAALVASAVNIHHFVLDGAIWKLRDGRIARILIRRDLEAHAQDGLSPARRVPGLRPVVFATAAAWLVISAVGTLEVEYGFRRAALNGDVERLQVAATRLRRVGRDSPAVHAQLALFAEAAGDYETGVREIERSLELHPTAEAWVILGRLHARSGRRARALAAYEKALQLDPANPDARNARARLSGRSR